MWQTDTVYLQTKTELNTYGSIKETWSRGSAVTCDVQEINKEYAYRAFGLTDAVEYRQIFDHTHANWVKGEQVEYNGTQWVVRLVNANMAKMGGSNHTYVVISRVVGNYEVPITVWILADGTWNDNGNWDDTDTWNDA